MRLPIQSLLIATSMLYPSLSLAAPAPLPNPNPNPSPGAAAAAAAANATSSTSSTSSSSSSSPVAHPLLSKRTQKDAKNACRPQFYTDWLGWGNFKKEGDGCAWKENGRKIKGRKSVLVFY